MREFGGGGVCSVLFSEGLQKQRGQTCMNSQYKWCFDKKSLVSQYFFIKLCTNLIDEDRCLAEYVEENVEENVRLRAAVCTCTFLYIILLPIQRKQRHECWKARVL